VCEQQVAEGSEWTEQELALLAKAVARCPGGVASRWEKISQMVGRSVKEVSVMSSVEYEVIVLCATAYLTPL